MIKGLTGAANFATPLRNLLQHSKRCRCLAEDCLGLTCSNPDFSRFRHEDGEPAADYANYADADVRLNGQLANLHPRNSRNPRLVPIARRPSGTSIGEKCGLRWRVCG